MTKLELAQRVRERLAAMGIHVPAVGQQKVIDAVVEEIADALASGEPVFIRGFAAFHVKKRAAKVGRHINEGKKLEIPGYNIPMIAPYPQLMKRVQQKVTKEGAIAHTKISTWRK